MPGTLFLVVEVPPVFLVGLCGTVIKEWMMLYVFEYEFGSGVGEGRKRREVPGGWWGAECR